MYFHFLRRPFSTGDSVIRNPCSQLNFSKAPPSPLCPSFTLGGTVIAPLNNPKNRHHLPSSGCGTPVSLIQLPNTAARSTLQNPPGHKASGTPPYLQTRPHNIRTCTVVNGGRATQLLAVRKLRAPKTSAPGPQHALVTPRCRSPLSPS